LELFEDLIGRFVHQSKNIMPLIGFTT
jgi:hypothetical protein